MQTPMNALRPGIPTDVTDGLRPKPPLLHLSATSASSVEEPNATGGDAPPLSTDDTDGTDNAVAATDCRVPAARGWHRSIHRWLACRACPGIAPERTEVASIVEVLSSFLQGEAGVYPVCGPPPTVQKSWPAPSYACRCSIASATLSVSANAPLRSDHLFMAAITSCTSACGCCSRMNATEESSSRSDVA